MWFQQLGTKALRIKQASQVGECQASGKTVKTESQPNRLETALLAGQARYPYLIFSGLSPIHGVKDVVLNWHAADLGCALKVYAGHWWTF